MASFPSIFFGLHAFPRIQCRNNPMQSICILLIAMLFFVRPDFATARVFERWKSAGNVEKKMEALGATELLSGNVTINNGDGQLWVHAFTQPLSIVWPRLEKSGGGATDKRLAGSMAFFSTSDKTHKTTYLGLALPNDNRTLVFALQQTQSQAEKSQKPLETHRLTSLPVYANSQPFFFAEHDQTGIKIEISKSSSNPVMIKSEMDALLRRDGWEQLAPAKPGFIPSLMAYGKHNQTCWLYVAPAAGNRPSSLTSLALIHKRTGNRKVF